MLRALKDNDLQLYISSGVQLSNVISTMLDYAGASDISIASFSVSEEFLRQMYVLKKKGLIKESTLILDVKAITKIARIMPLCRQVFDVVALSKNHSKIVLVGNQCACVTSQNATRGNRIEGGMITTIDSVVSEAYVLYNCILDKSIVCKE